MTAGSPRPPVPRAEELATALPAGLVDAVGALSPFDPGAQLAASAPAVLKADRQMVAALRGLLASSRSPATARAYQSDWVRFASWCGQQGREPLPADPLTLSLYLADAARTLNPATGQPAYAAATLDRWVTAIGRAHTTSGCASPGAGPLVRATVAGIHQVLGTAQHRKHPILLADLKALLRHLPAPGWPSGAVRRRDHALLLMSWAGAFRRSELAGLEVGDVIRHIEDGLHVTLRRSKTDQSRQGQLKPLPYGTPP